MNECYPLRRIREKMNQTKLVIQITGDRYWTNKIAICDYLSELFHINGWNKDGVIFISGGCRGVDNIVEDFCQQHGIENRIYPAEWDKYGRAAGPIRNRQMLDWEQPSLVLAFHNNIETSKGTKNMIHQAQKKGLTVWLVSEKS